MNRVYRASFFSTILTALFVAFPFASAHAADIVVTVTGDEYENYTDCTDDDPGTDCEYREAFRAASEDTINDHTITLPSGIFTIREENTSGDEDDSEEGDLDLTIANNTVTIIGQGADSTVLEQSLTTGDRILEIEGGSGIGSVSISGLTIRNGEISGSGNGGGISAQSMQGALTIEDVVFSGNEAGQYGGGLYAGAVDTVSISNTQFNSNSAEPGGGIYIGQADTEVDIDGVLFYGNDGGNATGALAIRHSEGPIEIINSVFYQNTGGYGALETFVGDEITEVNVLFSTFVDNEGTSSNSIDSRVWGAGTGSSTIIVTSSIITSSSATDDCGVSGVGTILSGGYNIENGDTCGFGEVTDSPDTDPLTDNVLMDRGGEFNIIGLHPNSPAIDAVPAAACVDADSDPLTEDIRGMTRPENEDCDIGAFERDQTDPEVSITAGDDTVECSVDTWTDAGATASDEFDTTVATASTEDTVDETTLGEQIVAYVSEADYDGNTGSANRTVTVVDTTAPVITVTGETSISHEAGTTYTDAGATATDVCDSSVSVSTTGSVDTDSLGEYTLTYSAQDDSSNSASAKQRTITVEDTIAPTITLSGSSTVTLTAGDTYTDAGATAEDSFEGDLTDDIEVTSTVDTDTAGTYTVTYTVADSSGNEAEAVMRTVTVEAADNDADSGEGDGSDDTEESLGAVTGLTRLSNNTVQVTYENGSSKTFQLFPNGTAKAKVQLHTNGNILIAINKKYIRTYDAFTGERLYSKKLFKNTQYKTKFKRYNVYKNAPGKNNIMVLAQTKKKQKKQFKLKAFVVQAGGKIVVRNTQSVTTNKNTAISKLNTKKNNKSGKKARIIVTRKGKNLADHKYKVTKKKGRIVLAQ